jgi:hypothetical protein
MSTGSNILRRTPFLETSMTRATHCLMHLAVAIAAVGPYVAHASAADPVWGTYTAGNGYQSNNSPGIWVHNGCSPFVQDQFLAVGFTVPANPPIPYRLDRIELTLDHISGDKHLTLRILNDDPMNGGPDSTEITEVNMDNVMTNGVNFLKGIVPSSPAVLLNPGQTYWLYPDISANTTNECDIWFYNAAGVNGLTALRSPSQGIPWAPGCSNCQQYAFRIVGTPVPAPAIKPSYTAYASLGASGVPTMATLHPEVFCPTNMLQFYCEINISIASGRSGAGVCQDIRDGINGMGAPECFYAAGVNSFHAECSGNVLRVTNSNTTPMVSCPGAYVCFDPAGVTAFAKSGSYEHLAVGGVMNLRFNGSTSGIPEDAGYNNSVHCVVSESHGDPPLLHVYDAELPLVAGMTDVQVAAAAAALLQSLGDGFASSNGPMLTFSPSSDTYDVAFRINDSGLQWFMSPFTDVNPFEFFYGIGECPPDFNNDGVVNSQDFFDFLSVLFAGTLGADFNHDGVVNSQDFFDFLTAFFAGC